MVMTATISGVPLIAVAYAWSQRGLAYFISTCGSTEPSPIKYESKFEDDWGNTSFKEVLRPNMLHFLYEYLPLIDEHNKQQQSLWALEKRWLTKNCWFRLVTTIVGMSVVDMHRYYRYDRIKNKGIPQSDIDPIRVLKFTDLLCGQLKNWVYKQQRIAVPSNIDGEVLLERIRDKDGKTTTEPTEKQREKGKNVGNPVVRPCFVCRRYATKDGIQRKQNTSFWCTNCHMPLCKVSRIGDDGGRELSCLDEHLCGDTELFRCGDLHKKGTKVPQELCLDLNPRRSHRRC